MKRVSWPVFIPLVVFIGLIAAAMAVLSHGQTGDKFAQHVDETAPETDLPLFKTKGKHFSTKDWLGKPYIINFFASWCGPCRAESEALLSLAQDAHIPIIGIAFKDKPKNLTEFLVKEGNPYVALASDEQGHTGIDWGITGVPETFLIDSKGVIRLHLTGPLSQDAIEEIVLPQWKDMVR